MFSDKKEKNTTMEPSASQNRINEGTKFTGDIESKGFFRIDGTIDGTVSGPSKVVLGKSGAIKGKLSCQNADIEGSFTGNLNVTGTLTLKASARIEGEVVVGKLAVEPGATFNATCSMQGAKKNAPTTDKQNPYDRSQRAKKTISESAE